MGWMGRRVGGVDGDEGTYRELCGLEDRCA